MTALAGNPFLAIPGPTNMPDAVLRAMHRPAIDIYAGEMVAITDSCLRDLKPVFGTSGAIYTYIANGHGAWEATLANLLSPGQKLLVLESGRFAVGWGEMAKQYGCAVEVLTAPHGGAVDPEAVRARLIADSGHEIAAILVVQIDTADGVWNDIQAIRTAIDAAGHPALYLVDTIASLGCVPFEMDAWGADVALAASQKGLMTPPGLSFVAVGPKARAVHQQKGCASRYWDWTQREGPEHYHKYCGTAPVHLMFGLRAALDLIKAEGLPAIHARHRRLAGAVRAAIAAWAQGGSLDFHVTDPASRADSVTTILMKDGDPDALRAFCQTTHGLTLGTGIGALSGKAFRIAHMGWINVPMILGTLATVELALQSLRIPHGDGGVAAAIAHLAAA